MSDAEKDAGIVKHDSLKSSSQSTVHLGSLHPDTTISGRESTPAVDNVRKNGSSGSSNSRASLMGRVSPEVMRDWILGFNDGISVPFALTAGLSSTGSSRIVVLAGVAELVSGAISMGVGGYLSAKTEFDHYRDMLAHTQQRVHQSMANSVASSVPPSRMNSFQLQSPTSSTPSPSAWPPMSSLEMEVEDILFDKFGVEPSRNLSRLLHIGLLQAERKNAIASSSSSLKGLTPFLLHVGYELDSMERKRVYQSALTIGMAYLFGGLIPLLPYIFCPNLLTALWISIGVTGATLLVFGGCKQQLINRAERRNEDCNGATVASLQVWSWRSSLYDAIATLAVSGAAAAACYGIVRAIEVSKKV